MTGTCSLPTLSVTPTFSELTAKGWRWKIEHYRRYVPATQEQTRKIIHRADRYDLTIFQSKLDPKGGMTRVSLWPPERKGDPLPTYTGVSRCSKIDCYHKKIGAGKALERAWNQHVR